VILIALQLTLTICLFEGLRDLILQIAGHSYNIVLSAVRYGVVIFLTYMIMFKYQSLIQQLGRQSDKLKESLGERIFELEKTNEEMCLELLARTRGE
jgi:hypothetical protein